MTEFVIRFLICNIFISIIIGILLLIKHVLKNHLTSRMHYNIWFLLLSLLAVPFIPAQPIHLPGNLGSVSPPPRKPPYRRRPPCTSPAEPIG